jgi:protein involved in polysaccharide export with SLBB domain
LTAASLFCGLSTAQFAAPVSSGTATGFSGAVTATPTTAAPAATAAPSNSTTAPTGAPTNLSPAALAAARAAGITGLGESSAPAPAGADTASFNTPSAQLPPLGTNQFASFVQETTGRSLPLYGYNLFGSSSFQSLTDVPVPANYVLGPGDDINLKIWGATDASLTLTVDRNGQVTIPKVGPVMVAGTRADQIEPLLKSHIGRTYANFELSATLGRLRSIQVFVVGQARKPGVYTVSSLSTLISALFESGGPTATGSMRQIQLVRSGKTISTIDLYKFIHIGDTSADSRLLPGDVIVIPPAGPRVALLGALDSPAIFELSGKEESLSQLLAYSGGQQVLTTPHKVLFERINPAQGKAPRIVEERALTAEGLNSTVRDGDVITLFKISPQFSNAVTLRGNVAAPLRYAYRPGMKVSDLIPEPSALIQSDYYTRKNILVQYESGKVVSAERVVNEVKNLLEEINWDYAAIERIDASEVRTTLIPFNLSKAIRDKDPANDLALLPGDVVTIFSVNDLPVPIEKRTQFARLGGEVMVPGIYQIQPGETLPRLIRRAGGFSSNAFAYGTVFTRESTRVQQQENLNKSIRRLESEISAQTATSLQNVTTPDKAASLQAQIAGQQLMLSRLQSLKASGRISLELDPNNPVPPPIALEDGDQIIIPQRPSFVGVFGEVFAESSLLHKPGNTVSDYLDKAGLTRDADTDNLMLIRADGSVESGARRSSLWSSSVTSKTLNPGDSVFVPGVLDRRTAYTQFIEGAKDWTSILFQFGLGAAALKTIRN